MQAARLPLTKKRSYHFFYDIPLSVYDVSKLLFGPVKCVMLLHARTGMT